MSVHESNSISRRRKRTPRIFLIAAVFLAAGFYIWLYRATAQHRLDILLVEAVRKDDVRLVKSALAQGANPNICDPPEVPLSLREQLSAAFQRDSQVSVSGQMPVVTMTMNEGKTFSFVSPYDHSLGARGSICMMISGRTMLELTVQSMPENVPLEKALLDAGARPDDNSYFNHETPLMMAVTQGRIKTVQMLLDYGANPLAKDEDGQFPINYLYYDDVTGYYNHNDTLKIAELLVRLGNKADATDRYGITPLMNVVEGDCDLPTVRFLIAHGANANARTKDGSSVLMYAVRAMKPEAAKLLLDHGAEVNVSDSFQTTPLDLAATTASIPIAEMLLAHGAKIDPVDQDGDTPLTTGVQTRIEGYEGVAKLLIAKGADVNHRNNAGQTALSLAKKKKYKDIIKLLEAAGAKRGQVTPPTKSTRQAHYR